MNILYMCNDMSRSGSPIGILTEAKELIKRGHKVSVISNFGPLVTELKKAGINYYEIMVPCHYSSIEPITKKDMILNSLFLLTKVYLKNLIKIFIKNKWSDILKLKKIILEEKFDCIIACQPGSVQVAHVVSKLTKIPFIIRVQHKLVNEFPPLFYKKVVQDSSKISVITKEIEEKLIKFYKITPDKIKIIPTGVDLEKFKNLFKDEELLKKYKQDKEDKILLNVSAHYPGKTMPIINLIKAIDELYIENKNLKLVLVGGGVEHERIQKVATEVNEKYSSKIIFCEGNQKNIVPFLSVADLGFGVGRSAMEMLTSGLNLICASHQGYGGLFTKENSEEIANFNFSGRNTSEKATVENLKKDILKYLKLKESKKNELKEFGSNFVLENYFLTNIIDETEKILKSIKIKKYGEN